MTERILFDTDFVATTLRLSPKTRDRFLPPKTLISLETCVRANLFNLFYVSVGTDADGAEVVAKSALLDAADFRLDGVGAPTLTVVVIKPHAGLSTVQMVSVQHDVATATAFDDNASPVDSRPAPGGRKVYTINIAQLAHNILRELKQACLGSRVARD